MKSKYVFAYIYQLLLDNKIISRDYRFDAKIKTNKVLYFAELMHRILFKKELITDAKYYCLEHGPAVDIKHIGIDDKYIDLKKIKNYSNHLSEEEKEEISICVKKFLAEQDTEDLVNITHRDNKDFPLEAWKDNISNNRYGEVPLSNEDLDKDAKILRDSILQKYFKD